MKLKSTGGSITLDCSKLGFSSSEKIYTGFEKNVTKTDKETYDCVIEFVKAIKNGKRGYISKFLHAPTTYVTYNSSDPTRSTYGYMGVETTHMITNIGDEKSFPNQTSFTVIFNPVVFSNTEKTKLYFSKPKFTVTAYHDTKQVTFRLSGEQRELM